MVNAAAAGAMLRLCVLTSLSLSAVVTSQHSCPKDCRCSYTATAQLAAFCKGESLSHVTSQLPTNTAIYQYEAREPLVNLAATNFSHLSSLESLQLVSQYDRSVMQRLIDEIPADKQTVFSPLTNLRQLKISINWELGTALPELFSGLQRLETLDLSYTRQLHYGNLKDTLKGLENSTSFRALNLHNSQTLEILKSGMTLDLNELLDPLKNCPLEELDISYNVLRKVVPGILSKAPRLKKIDASNNMIIPLLSGAFFYEVVSHPSLEEADFSEQGLGEPQRNPSNDNAMLGAMERLEDNNDSAMLGAMERLEDNNDSAMLGTMWWLEDNSGRRQVHYMHHPLYHSNKDCSDELQSDICNIFSPECATLLHDFTVHHQHFCDLLYILAEYIQYIPCAYIPPIRALLSRDCGNCFVFPLTGNVRRLYLQMTYNYDQMIAFPIFTKKTCFNPNNSLEILDFSRNRDHGYTDIDSSFSTTMQGFDSMKTLNLSYNRLQHPSPDLGSNLPQIEVFDLSFNLLDLVGKYGDFLAGATTTRELNLAGNVIEKIPYSRFYTLSLLQTLNLSSNNLHDFSVDIRNLTQLSVIDLSGNEISSFSDDMISQLDAQATNLQNSSLVIDLSHNSLLCTCNVRHFMDWVLSQPHNIDFLHFQQYMCFNDDASQVLFHTRSKIGIFDCLSKRFYIGVGVGSGILSSIIVAALIVGIYRKRWWIRYHYFIARRMWINSRKQEQVSHQFRYDVFVSYSSRDQDWVDEVLQPKLEDENRIGLCLHQRDFPIGSEITEQILESIDNSRKTLLILTPHFVQSTWCQYEMKEAHSKLCTAGRDVLLLAILKPLPNVESKVLKALLEEKVYVEWTEDQYGQKLFWEKLIAALDIPQRRAGAQEDPGEPHGRAGAEEDPDEPQRRAGAQEDPGEPQRRAGAKEDPGEPQGPEAPSAWEDETASDEAPLIINHSSNMFMV